MIKQILFYPVTFCVLVVLHLMCRTHCTMLDASPNVLLIMVVFLSALRGRAFGETIGFVTGLCADVFSVGPFGAHAFVGTLIGFVAGGLRRTLDITQVRVHMLVIWLFSFGAVIAFLLIEQVFLDTPVHHALARVALEPFWNALAAPIVIWCYRQWYLWWHPNARSMQ